MQINDCTRMNIRKSRKLMKMTQKEFADILNVDHSTVSSWERGKNSIDLKKLNQLCEVMNTPLYEVIFEKEEELHKQQVAEKGEGFIEILKNSPEIKELYEVCKESSCQDIQIAIKLIKDLKKINFEYEINGGEELLELETVEV